MDLIYEKPDWQTPAGRLLDLLATKLPGDPPMTILVFGSAPLQLLVDSTFLSQDVDIIGGDNLQSLARDLFLPLATGDLTLQVCDRLTFRTALGWEDRAYREVRQGHLFVFPHPWDILVAKLGRLEEKDLEAYRLVIGKTGHPTASEFKAHLQLAVDLYRPNFDEEHGADYTTQTAALWREIFGTSIDVRAEIIRPALERRKAHYDADAGDPRWKERLRHLGN